MNAARRNAARRGWPRGLYEPRPGYFTWRHPMTGETLIIGRVSLAVAKSEALAANLHVEGAAPSLVERLASGSPLDASTEHTLADVLEKMPAAKKANTAKTWRTLDKTIREALGGVVCAELTTARCAELVEGIEAQGKARTAQALRSRLVAVCQRAQQLGWLHHNPAEATRQPKVLIKRGRLATLEMFQQIRARADEVAGWLGHLMDLALVTAADRSTLSGLTRTHVLADVLVLKRSKTEDSTGLVVHVPLDLELRVAGLKLRDLVRNTTGIASKFLIHHTKTFGNAPRGSQVFVDRMSHAFTEARRLAGIPDVLPNGQGAPTLHEVRSLAKRLYEEQGDVDTVLLLGHTDKRTAKRYADPRGAHPVRVQIGKRSEQQVNTK